MNRHTYNLGLIGNCSFQALIDTEASVKWLCWPKFDSSFIFGGLLDDEKGGEFSINSVKKINSTCQEYIKNTNVLATEISTDDGRYKVTDFAPRFEQYDRHYKPLMFIRKITPMEGTPEIQVVCDPRGEYGKIVPEVSTGSSHLRYKGLEDEVRLTTNLSLHYIKEGKAFK